MTLAQGIELAQLAKAKGYALQAEVGKVQFVTVKYGSDGSSIVTPHTNPMDYAEAKELLEQA